eukprot:754108-Hanusia_phi.AAC.6
MVTKPPAEEFCDQAGHEGSSLHENYEHVWAHTRIGGQEVTVVALKRKRHVSGTNQHLAGEQSDHCCTHQNPLSDTKHPSQEDMLNRLHSDYLSRFWKSDSYHGKNWFPFPPPKKLDEQVQEDDFGSGEHLSLQYNFPLGRMRDVAMGLSAASMFEQGFAPSEYLGRIVEVKFVGGWRDAAMLGASQASCCFNVYWRRCAIACVGLK